MSAKQMYLEPISPWAVHDTELARLREQVVKAEADVVRAPSWVERTRREQDLKTLRHELNVVEMQRRAEAQQVRVNTPARDEHAEMLANALAWGRCVSPVSYWRTGNELPSHDDDAASSPGLAQLQALAKELEAAVADISISATIRSELRDRLLQVQEAIQKLVRPSGTPASSSGSGAGAAPTQNAANSRREALSFEQTSRMVALAREAGVFKSA